jgi:hypothetical protein
MFRTLCTFLSNRQRGIQTNIFIHYVQITVQTKSYFTLARTDFGTGHFLVKSIMSPHLEGIAYQCSLLALLGTFF